MPDNGNGQESRAEVIEGIPLYLIPKTVSDQVWTKRKSLLRIVVERGFRYQYTVRVEMLGDPVPGKDRKRSKQSQAVRKDPEIFVTERVPDSGEPRHGPPGL